MSFVVEWIGGVCGSSIERRWHKFPAEATTSVGLHEQSSRQR